MERVLKAAHEDGGVQDIGQGDDGGTQGDGDGQTRQGKQDGTAVLRLVMAVRQGAHVPAVAKIHIQRPQHTAHGHPQNGPGGGQGLIL